MNHAECCVAGDTHIHTIEGFRALLKRGMLGSFHGESRKYLQHNVDGFCCRYDLCGTDLAYVFGFTWQKSVGL